MKSNDMSGLSEHFYAVIMAGGGGTRLWPLSRRTHPKQMLALFDERSMFQTAVERIQDLFPPERIFVVTVQEQARHLQEQCRQIPTENFLIEPMARGTASVVGLAAAALAAHDPDAVMAVLGSDHYIADEVLFRQLLVSAGLAAQDGYLVTLGIQPGFPSTGFGYIARGSQVGIYAGKPVFQVKEFIEKPGQSQAEAMLAEGGYDWNSGMFIWRADRILDEIQRQMPGLYQGVKTIQQDWFTPQSQATVERVWTGLQNVTIDYGVMENARNVVVLPASGLGWSDIGSWDSFYDLLAGDEHGNIIMRGDYLGLDTAGSLVYTNQPRRLVVTIGVEELVIVDTGDVLLVCNKNQVQKVRQIVSQLKENGQDYL